MSVGSHFVIVLFRYSKGRIQMSASFNCCDILTKSKLFFHILSLDEVS